MMPRLKQSWLTRLAALERKRADARKTHYTFLFDHQSSKAWREELIASGEARATDKFVHYRWVPPTTGGDGSP